jgi:hypothetical protein
LRAEWSKNQTRAEFQNKRRQSLGSGLMSDRMSGQRGHCRTGGPDSKTGGGRSSGCEVIELRGRRVFDQACRPDGSAELPNFKTTSRFYDRANEFHEREGVYKVEGLDFSTETEGSGGICTLQFHSGNAINTSNPPRAGDKVQPLSPEVRFPVTEFRRTVLESPPAPPEFGPSETNSASALGVFPCGPGVHLPVLKSGPSPQR